MMFPRCTKMTESLLSFFEWEWNGRGLVIVLRKEFDNSSKKSEGGCDVSPETDERARYLGNIGCGRCGAWRGHAAEHAGQRANVSRLGFWPWLGRRHRNAAFRLHGLPELRLPRLQFLRDAVSV